MKTILAAFLAVAFLASTPAFAGDKPEGDKSGKKDKKGDKKSGDEKKDEGAKTGGGW